MAKTIIPLLILITVVSYSITTGYLFKDSFLDDAFILASCYLIGGEQIPLWSIYIGCLSIALTALFLFLILDTLRMPGLGLFAATMVLLGMAQSHWHLGMETNLFTALLLASLLLASKGQYTLAFLIGAISILTRYDAVLFVSLLWIVFSIKEQRLLWKETLWGTMVLLPWLLFAWGYYGSPLPVSLAAKRGCIPFATYLSESLLNIEMIMILPLVLITSSHFQPSLYLHITLGALFFYGSYCLIRRDSTFLIFAIWPIIHLIIYSLIGPGLSFGWHLYPIYPLLIAIYGAGVFNLLSRLPALRWNRASTIRTSLFLTIVFVASYFAGSFLVLSNVISSYPNSYWNGGRYKRYAEISRWIITHTPSNSSVLLDDAGAIGYFTKRRIIDAQGLVTPKAAHQQIKTIIQIFHPDYLLLQEGRDDVPVECIVPREYIMIQEFKNCNFYHYTMWQKNGSSKPRRQVIVPLSGVSGIRGSVLVTMR